MRYSLVLLSADFGVIVAMMMNFGVVVTVYFCDHSRARGFVRPYWLRREVHPPRKIDTGGNVYEGTWKRVRCPLTGNSEHWNLHSGIRGVTHLRTTICQHRRNSSSVHRRTQVGETTTAGITPATGPFILTISNRMRRKPRVRRKTCCDFSCHVRTLQFPARKPFLLLFSLKMNNFQDFLLETGLQQMAS